MRQSRGYGSWFGPLAMAAATVCLQGLIPAARGQQASDDAEMVFVPAGVFTMGSTGKALDEDAAEKPVQQVSLPAFYLDKYEVTNAQYARFLNAVGRTKDAANHEYLGSVGILQLEQVDGRWRPKPGKATFPVGNVTWYGAAAYARWAGKRLPTEAEWEKAARGSDARKFPWGDTMDFSKFRLGVDRLSPVGSLPAGVSPYGCLNMADNVWEWTSSLFKPYPYRADDGREDPRSEERRVARGGSWSGEPYIAHSAYRFRPEPTFTHDYLGFRCAKSAP